MHIPDNFLDTKTALVTGVLAASGLGLALWHARRHLPPRRVPLLGLAAAFVFAAQMINFPVLAGTSGHLVGAVLSAVLLGPSEEEDDNSIWLIIGIIVVSIFVGAIWLLKDSISAGKLY